MIIKDQLPLMKVAIAKVIKMFKFNLNCHCTSKYLNNLIEQDHRCIKFIRTRHQSFNTAKNKIKEIEFTYKSYNKN